MVKEKQYEERYQGWKTWKPTDEELANFYMTPKEEVIEMLPFEMLENEYLLILDKDDTLIDTYCKEGDHLRKFGHGAIKPRPKVSIVAKNNEQKCAFDLMHNEKVTVKLLTGTWGSGKTFILVSAALEALQYHKFDRIVWIRNNVDVKDTKDLGALPGEVNDKLKPFLGPFIDHCGEKEVSRMIEDGLLTVEPLQSLRGRNFENTLIICSEAENLTKEHIQLIIARAAEGSAVWLDADIRQRDKAAFEKSKGIETLVDRLKGNELFGYVHLVKTERSATARLADLLND